MDGIRRQPLASLWFTLTWLLVGGPFLVRTQGAALVWTGAVDFSWHDPDNWSTGEVPAPGDDVVIGNSGGEVVITNSITLGSLRLSGDTMLAGVGADCRLAVGGPVVLAGAGLAARTGALLKLASATELVWGDTAGAALTIAAEGNGSLLDLSGLTRLDGVPTGSRVRFVAHDGGAISLGALSVLDPGTASFEVESAGSFIDLSQLLRLPGCEASVSGRGALLWLPRAVDATGAQFHAGLGATLRFQGLARYSAGTSPGAEVALESQDGGSLIDLPALQTIEGHRNGGRLGVTAFNGGKITAPALTTIAGGNLAVRAEGYGSDIELLHLQVLTIQTGEISFEAQSRGNLFLASPFLAQGVRLHGVRAGLQPPLSVDINPDDSLTLVGAPQSAYAIGYRTDLTDPTWKLLTRVVLADNQAAPTGIEVDPSISLLRVTPIAPDPPILEIQRREGQYDQLILYGQPGVTYALETGADPGGAVNWGQFDSVQLKTSFRVLPLLELGGTNPQFIRARVDCTVAAADPADPGSAMSRPSVFCPGPASPRIDANRLTYLDSSEPFYAGQNLARLTTPQWIGEDGVDAALLLGIDDLKSDDAHFETFLRPILKRLEKIDGRGALSIFCIKPEVTRPLLQAWMKEGVSLEAHTLTHACPLLSGSNFVAAAASFHGNVDLLYGIPGNQPVAFRTPCADSMNSPSPRLFAELLNRPSPAGHFIQLDSSVINLFTARDPQLPRAMVFDGDGRSRFEKYLLSSNLVTRVENYPYPYVIDRTLWEIPLTTPSDYEAMFNNGKTNAVTLEDWKRAVDATVVKQGVFNLVFHPHGWCTSDQVVALVDHAVAAHGARVKFLSFREALDRLTKNLLGGQALRTPTGGDNGVRLLDLDGDGFQDVIIANDRRRETHLWRPESRTWQISTFPFPLVGAEVVNDDGQIPPQQTTELVDVGAHFGILHRDGFASALLLGVTKREAWHFNGSQWVEQPALLKGLELGGELLVSRSDGRDRGVRLRDLDGDGICELIVGNDTQNAVFAWDEAGGVWHRLPYGLPDGTAIVDAAGLDAGLRFVDVDADGFADVIFSNEDRYSVNLFAPPSAGKQPTGWTIQTLTGTRASATAGPAPLAESLISPRILEALARAHDSTDGCGCDPTRPPKVEAITSLRDLEAGPRPAGPPRPVVIPPFVRAGPYHNNGAWFHSHSVWVQNEDTAGLRDFTDHRSYLQLLNGYVRPAN